MKADTDHTIPDAPSFKKLILDRRGSFGTLNVARLGELIRRISSERRKAFETVPILVHLNAEGLPGYVDHPRTPHGIYRFYESGFWKIGRKRLGIDEASSSTFLLKRYYVRGIYLAGSAGTLGQTTVSDLNYWIVLDPESVDEQQRELLLKKLDGIREWALENHGQALTFLVLDFDQIRKNDFSSLGDPYRMLPHGHLLKEEFYRTSLLIGGQIPFWAVLPDGLKDDTYARWTEEARRLSDPDFLAEDYVDLGPVSSIPRGECAPALLTQIYRFQEDPVRSLIKASLVAHHSFFQEHEGLLCDSIKRSFSTPKSKGEPPAPSTYGFERAVRLHEGLDDEEGVHLIRRCAYLRMAGYPGPPPSEDSHPSRDALDRFRREWAWSSDEARHNEAYTDWTEAERLGLEARILHKLWLLFDLVDKAGEGPKEKGVRRPRDLDRLRKRVEERLASRPDRIPYASAPLRARRGSLTVRVEPGKDSAGGERWVVHDHWSPASRKDGSPLFSDVHLARVLGWIVLNGLYDPKRTSVVFTHAGSATFAKRAEVFLLDLLRFFPLQPSAEVLHSDHAWQKLLVILRPDLGGGRQDLSSADFLIQDTWGGLFHVPLDLGQVENNLLRCYEIATRVRQYQGGAAAAGWEYLIHHSRTIEGTQAAKNIEEFIETVRDDDSGKPVP